MIESELVEVDAVPTALNTAEGVGSDPVRLKVRNESGSSVWLGGDDVSTSTGLTLATASETELIELASGEVPYAVAADTGGTATPGTTTGGVAAVAEVQSLTVDATGGTFTVSHDGNGPSDPIDFNDDGSGLQAALEAFASIGSGGVVVTGGPGDSGGTTPYVLTFDAALGAVAEITADGGSLTGGAGTATPGTTTPGVTAVDEVQSLTVTAEGGTYTITYDGQTTAAVAFDATAAAVQAALEALSNIDPGDVTVSGGPGDEAGSTPYVLTFGGAVAGTDVAEITTTATGLLAASVSVRVLRIGVG